jgi:hypothetical protein
MLHFLLILLALVALWKLLGHGASSSASLLRGLRRVAVVLAIASAALGGVIGYYATPPNTPGAAALGAAAGFGLVWTAASVVIWMIRGF